MLSRMVFILLLILYVALAVSEPRKYKADGLLRTMSSPDLTGKKFYVEINTKKSSKLKSKICKLPLDIGPCPDAKQRYYFDLITNECKLFTYSGCRGNENNFRSLSKCQKTCKV